MGFLCACFQAEVDAAASALRLLCGRLVCVTPVASSSAEGARTAVVVQKQAGTPNRCEGAVGGSRREQLRTHLQWLWCRSRQAGRHAQLVREVGSCEGAADLSMHAQ